jgi:hypothetical protein
MLFPKGKPTSQARLPNNETQPHWLPTILKAIFYESRVDNSGDHYEVVVSPVKWCVTVFIFNKDILIAQFDVSHYLMSAGPKPLLEYLNANALTERSLGAGWHGIDRPVVWS